MMFTDNFKIYNEIIDQLYGTHLDGCCYVKEAAPRRIVFVDAYNYRMLKRNNIQRVKIKRKFSKPDGHI